MKRSAIFTRTVFIVALFFLAGGLISCGDSDSDDALLEGQFVDSRVAGLSYEAKNTAGTVTFSGVTDAKGKFKYRRGNKVTFFIGGIILGTVEGKSLITPVDLVEDAVDETDPKVTNICRLLHSLDDDDRPDNGILIIESVRTAAVNLSVDFSLSIIEFGNNFAVQQAVSVLTALTSGGERPLALAITVQVHLRATLVNLHRFTDDDGDGFTEIDGDCNDQNATIYPGADEICGDGIDQDCSGCDASCTPDADNDGDGFTENTGDCNDNNPLINPDADEICGDGVDQNCDGEDDTCETALCEGTWTGTTDQGYEITFNVTGGQVTAISTKMDYEDVYSENCVGTNLLEADNLTLAVADNQFSLSASEVKVSGEFESVSTVSGTWFYQNATCGGAGEGTWTAVCDNEVDNDGDGYKVSEGDCNDNDSSIHPDAEEICDDGIDQNCDGTDLTCSVENSVVLANGFQITFLGVTYNDDGASVWRYQVDETAESKDLSNWVLSLPSCAVVVSASPDDSFETVNPDPNANLAGIKWETVDSFSTSEFTVTLSGTLTVGMIDVAAKGPDVSLGRVAGPICGTAQKDLDGDGVTVAEGDCDDTDASVYPGAEEICGDGIDQDCDGSDAACEPVDVVTLSNGFTISFISVVYNSMGTSTWTYTVEELAEAQDLSNWVLELPSCAVASGITPEPNELVDPDPNAQISGIKWQTGAGFESGTFQFTLDAHYAVVSVSVAAKGPDVVTGSISGPSCDLADEEENTPDVDNDGDGLSEDQGDCDDTNKDIFPGATETCGDGIDQDCDGSDLICIGEENTCDNLSIPDGALPPDGECKVWDPDLTAGQQGSPVACDCSLVEPGTCLIDHNGNVVDCTDI